MIDHQRREAQRIRKCIEEEKMRLKQIHNDSNQDDKGRMRQIQKDAVYSYYSKVIVYVSTKNDSEHPVWIQKEWPSQKDNVSVLRNLVAAMCRARSTEDNSYSFQEGTKIGKGRYRHVSDEMTSTYWFENSIVWKTVFVFVEDGVQWEGYGGRGSGVFVQSRLDSKHIIQFIYNAKH